MFIVLPGYSLERKEAGSRQGVRITGLASSSWGELGGKGKMPNGVSNLDRRVHSWLLTASGQLSVFHLSACLIDLVDYLQLSEDKQNYTPCYKLILVVSGCPGKFLENSQLSVF